jgi:hypothetical protein
MTWARAIVAGVVGIGRFVWDFLVGDTPEIFVAVCIAIAGVAWVSHHRHSSLGGWVLLAATFVILGGSVFKAIRASKKK